MIRGPVPGGRARNRSPSTEPRSIGSALTRGLLVDGAGAAALAALLYTRYFAQSAATSLSRSRAPCARLLTCRSRSPSDRTLADRRALHHRARRQDRSHGGRGGAFRRRHRPAAANACPTRAMARPSRRRSRDRRRAAMPSPQASIRLALQTAMPAGAARNALDCAFWDLEAKRQRTIRSMRWRAWPRAAPA